MDTINRKGYQIKARTNAAEILIYEDIGENFAGGISAKQFVEDLGTVKNVENINIRINSNGGNVFDGNTIYNALKRHKANVTVDIDGLAASIASIIAMAGDEVRIAENGFMMIHDPWMMTGGTADDLRNAADTMDKVRDQLVGTYVNRTGMDAKQVSDMMNEETWMNAGEALKHGFVDSITEDSAMAAQVRDPSRYKHTPEALVAIDRPRSDKLKRDVQTYLAASLKQRNL